MGGNSAFSLREKAARTREVLASIGQGLREQYDPLQPFSRRLAELVGKIEQSISERKAELAFRGRVSPRREPDWTDASHRVVRGKAMSPADYRRRAEELVSIADRVGDYRSRAALLAMAQSWQHLAAQAEKNLQIVLVYETPEPHRPVARSDGNSRSPILRKRTSGLGQTSHYGPSRLWALAGKCLLLRAKEKMRHWQLFPSVGHLLVAGSYYRA
jgi:hypothetical protein